MKSFVFALVLCGITLPVWAGSEQEAAREIDRILEQHWKQKGLETSPIVDDATFVRRIYLDVIGRIPTGKETATFLNDKTKNKRTALLDELLESEGYINHQFNFRADILRIHSQQGGGNQVVPAYIEFVKKSIRENVPYDKFVYELLTAEGESYENGATGYYYRDRGMPLDHMANTVRIFLGTRLECAQCHNHPFDKWTQKDFFHMAAFSYGMNTQNRGGGSTQQLYQKMQRNKDLSREEKRNLQRAFQEIRRPLRNSVSINYDADKLPQLPHDYQYDDAKPKEKMAEKVMFGTMPAIESPNDRLSEYAKWMTAKDNPRFTTVIANRMWKKVFGLGMIEPVDELIDQSMPAIPELMTFLEKEMRESNYDLKRFQKVLFLTKVYQRESGISDLPIPAAYGFTGPVMRRMSAEQIWDSIVVMINPNPEAGNWRREQELLLRNMNASLMTKAIGKIPEDQLLKKVRHIANAQKSQQNKLLALQKKQAEARKNNDKEEIQRLGREANKIRQNLRDQVYTSVFKPALKKMGNQVIRVSLPEGETMTMKMDTSKMYNNGNAPKEMLNKLSRKELELFNQEMDRLGINDPRERRGYSGYRRSVANTYIRAAHLPSPAPRGHFLRQFGQSDRETIENAETAASVPQALTMLNGPLFQSITNRYSVITRAVKAIDDPLQQIEMIYLSLLNRKPTADEINILKPEAETRGDAFFMDLTFALLNNQEFFFIK